MLEHVLGAGVLDEGIHFLPKPFTSDAHLRSVRTVLDARAAPQLGF